MLEAFPDPKYYVNVRKKERKKRGSNVVSFFLSFFLKLPEFRNHLTPPTFAQLNPFLFKKEKKEISSTGI